MAGTIDWQVVTVEATRDETPRVRSLTLEEVDRSVRPGERVIFSEGSGAERLLGEGWSAIEPTGVWSDGEHARLVLRLADGVPEDVELALNVSPFVAPNHPVLEVESSAGGERLALHTFRHGEAPRLVRVPLPAEVRAAHGRCDVDLALRTPARPIDLGLGDDARRLGVQLRWLIVRQATRRAKIADAARRAYARGRRFGRS